MTATVADLLIQLNHNFVQSKSRTRRPAPKFMRRPGDVAKPDAGERTFGAGGGMTPEQLRARLAAHASKNLPSAAEQLKGG